MRAYLRDPSEAPTPPLYRSQPRRRLSPSSTHTHESSSHTHTHSVPTPLSTDVLSSSSHTPAPAVLHPRSTSSRVARPSTPIRVRARIQTRALCCVQRCMTLYLRSQHSRIPTICSHRTPALSHFTLRSGPRRAPPALPPAPPRARRRPTHVLGVKVQPQEEEAAARRERVVLMISVRAEMRVRWSRRMSLIRRIWISIFVCGTSSRRLRYRSLGPRMTYSLGGMGGRGCQFDMPVRRKVSMGIRIRGNGISTYIVGEIV